MVLHVIFGEISEQGDYCVHFNDNDNAMEYCLSELKIISCVDNQTKCIEIQDELDRYYNDNDKK